MFRQDFKDHVVSYIVYWSLQVKSYRCYGVLLRIIIWANYYVYLLRKIIKSLNVYKCVASIFFYLISTLFCSQSQFRNKKYGK